MSHSGNGRKLSPLGEDFSLIVIEEMFEESSAEKISKRFSLESLAQTAHRNDNHGLIQHSGIMFRNINRFSCAREGLESSTPWLLKLPASAGSRLSHVRRLKISASGMDIPISGV